MSRASGRLGSSVSISEPRPGKPRHRLGDGGWEPGHDDPRESTSWRFLVLLLLLLILVMAGLQIWSAVSTRQLVDEAMRAPIGQDVDIEKSRQETIGKRIELGASDAATRIVVPSTVTKARLMAAYGSAEARIEVVPNMLSEAAAPTAEMGRFETKRVVFLGRLSRQKGVDRFAKLAAAVGGSDLQASFEVFGDGEQRDQLAQWGLIWRGSLGWDERGKAFGGASAVLVPLRSEPYGMVILEAMRHRVPVIYPPDSGAAEVLQSGIKVSGNDVDAMAGHVTRLLSSIGEWEGVVRAEGAEIEGYPRRGNEDEMIAVWRQTASEAVAA